MTTESKLLVVLIALIIAGFVTFFVVQHQHNKQAKLNDCLDNASSIVGEYMCENLYK